MVRTSAWAAQKRAKIPRKPVAADQAWLALVKRHGPHHGLGHLARRIFVTRNGHYYVPIPEERHEIMALRGQSIAEQLRLPPVAPVTKQRVETAGSLLPAQARLKGGLDLAGAPSPVRTHDATATRGRWSTRVSAPRAR